LTNPLYVTPRYFMAKRVVPPRVVPDGEKNPKTYVGDANPSSISDDGKPYAAHPLVTRSRLLLPIDPRKVSVAEGFDADREFSTEGNISVEFRQDRVTVSLTPANEDRFLVLNELYHPDWKATTGDQDLRIWVTNGLMRGVVVPKGATEVVFTFRPFLTGAAVLPFIGVGLILAITGWWLFVSNTRRRLKPATPTSSIGIRLT